jgi:hypothetical protein
MPPWVIIMPSGMTLKPSWVALMSHRVLFKHPRRRSPTRHKTTAQRGWRLLALPSSRPQNPAIAFLDIFIEIVHVPYPLAHPKAPFILFPVLLPKQCSHLRIAFQFR